MSGNTIRYIGLKINPIPFRESLPSYRLLSIQVPACCSMILVCHLDFLDLDLDQHPAFRD